MDSLHSSRVETRGGYSAEQLEAIKLFGRKDLTEGCRVICSDGILRTIVDDCEFTIQTNGGPEWNYQGMANENEDIGIIEILGHEVHLEDVFRVAKERGIYVKVSGEYNEISLFKYHTLKKAVIRYNPTLPLLDQPSLPEIINLFKNG